MFKLILLTLLNFFGVNFQEEPARLDKKIDLSISERIHLWAIKHQFELVFVLIMLMMCIFVLVIFICVPAMDPWTNHFQDVI